MSVVDISMFDSMQGQSTGAYYQDLQLTLNLLCSRFESNDIMSQPREDSNDHGVQAFSAPSKAMVAGGYLILEPRFRSFVTALSCRMHAVIGPINSQSFSDDQSIIRVSSPQFGGHWNFSISKELKITETTGSKNPFLEASIRTIIGYVRPTQYFRYQITLFSDPGYHTQEQTIKKTSNTQKRLFLYHEKSIDQVPKTGLGLSAGFVTVVTTCLLTNLLRQPLSAICDTVHKVAQIAHCDAQGKIGSGFDIATAVYGSIVYKRFKPEVINHLLGRKITKEYSADITDVINSDWKFTSSSCSLPPGLKLLMGDVKTGSETPKLVGKVLAWRKSNPESDEVYEQLDCANEAFMSELLRLNDLYSSDPTKYMASLSDSSSMFETLKATILAIRKGLQNLTARSGAEIEPEEQSQLLDNCLKLVGSLGGLVPGAGGYDAICVFVEESKANAFKRQSSLDSSFDGVTWLDLSEESEGLLEEVPTDYCGL